MKLFISQYGEKFYANTVKELRSQINMGGSRVSKMYVDTKDGRTKHVGYVIGDRWLDMFIPYEKEV